LTSDVPTHSRVWQRINDSTYSRGEVNESFDQLIGCHDYSSGSMCNFQFAIFNFRDIKGEALG
jgi:hypothetical protein